MDKDEAFRHIADRVIDLANELIGDHDPVLVSTALLYGASRFSAFTVASQAEDVEQFRQEKQPASDYYAQEFSRMLAENLEDYESHLESTLKYAHLMKPQQ